MPIQCSEEVTDLSLEDFRELDYGVMRHMFDAHNQLGFLAAEAVFQRDLLSRLNHAGTRVIREVPVHLSHKGYSTSLFLDLLVASSGVYELKVVRTLNDTHRGQLLTYLCLLDLRRGKLVNFGGTSVQSEFVNAPMTNLERRSFSVVDDGFIGPRRFLDLVVGLLRDWGTCLTLSIYQDALVHLLGGKNDVVKQLPLNRGKVLLGTQLFHMTSELSAFRITAFKEKSTGYPKQLQRLIAHCPLNTIHWINIRPRTVELTTIHAP